MIKRYSFLNHPFYFVLANANQMVAGIDKVVAVYYNQTQKQLEVLEYTDKLDSLTFDDDYINDLRKAKEKYNWINQSQVPFETSKVDFGQLTFDDEKNNSVLELRFKNKYDNRYDVLYLYFKSNIGNFKLSSIDEAMAVAVKEVIQRLLHQQIELIIKDNDLNSEIHEKISASFNHVDLQLEIDRVKKEKFNQSKAIYSYILNKLIHKEAFEMVLSNNAIEKLLHLNVSLESVEQILLDSIEVVVNKHRFFDFFEITAEDIFINSAVERKTTTSIKQEQLLKTVQFLDKYESAAKLLISKNEKITGLNIGAYCSPEVSPAAISDVLKKHSKKIIVLLNAHPEKWLTIRKQFKPLRNIYEKQAQSYHGLMGA
ncbi:hypothetical protein FRY74_04715 [Vicingus serpentipes]|uniref:Uncharacterized protein n=1 Tax=Vicingus serpentipes TaxID=1926625 RepID=A0A5C6RTS3_9FLAO|nr:hypothetical protein [Vicingus serpentipes]TXB65876.1 hypothetical protein FRY74_04715 [Vicingus serpentipes]